MKKIISIMLCAVIIALSLSACSVEFSTGNSHKLKIVTTIFPVYDWVNEILGSKAVDAEVTMLLNSGVDLHSYQPSAEDIVKISSSDLFIYIGGESDTWVADTLQSAVKGNVKSLNLLGALGGLAKTEQVVEGMQAEEEEQPAADEHIWLSLKNAKVLCTEIEKAIAELDPENADAYAENLNAYCNRLSSLDIEYQACATNEEKDTVVFCDRFPFRYMFEDYGLKYYAAFSGCSAESEASFETIKFLSDKVKELSLDCVAIIDGSDGSIANTVISNIGNEDIKIVSFNSMQSITAQKVEEGADYYTIMQENLSALSTALGGVGSVTA